VTCWFASNRTNSAGLRGSHPRGELSEYYLSAERAGEPGVYVSFNEIQEVDDGKVVLRVQGMDIDLMGWSKIPVP
jgi:hypothetical protein